MIELPQTTVAAAQPTVKILRRECRCRAFQISRSDPHAHLLPTGSSQARSLAVGFYREPMPDLLNGQEFVIELLEAFLLTTLY